ncbi:MAG: hypothetical protein IT518_27190, partial [Burkholderiales bacterium]|nr:hypothetical protein [Burkholderiales bacterium]
NLTGFVEGVLDDKLIEIFRDAMPKARRVVIAEAPLSPRAGRAAELLRIEVVALPLNGAGEFDGFFAQVRRMRPDGVIVPNVNWLASFAERLAQGLLAARMPSIAQWHDFARAGGMLAYGPIFGAAIADQRVAVTDAILRGAHPRDIPVQTPTHYRLMVNLVTAKALGVTIPSNVLLQARPEDVIRS